jgi:vacuolar-type H+-ATPase subunit I/STV1
LTAPQELSVAQVLNGFNVDTSRQCLIAELWTPSARIADVRGALQTAGVGTFDFFSPPKEKL